MSNNDYITNLLNIKDKNIHIIPNIIDNVAIKGKNTKVIYGILTYTPEFCSCCGQVNESTNDIIKWGFKRRCKVKIPKISNFNSLLLLDKQRFYCKNCSNTFIAETSLVDKNCNISNNTNLFVRTELMMKTSQKDIAKRANISTSSVEEILVSLSKTTVLRHESLPKLMNWDEFKATKDTKGKMAFIIMNNKKGTIFDILDSRFSYDLEKYFSRYSRSERNKVKVICTDFYKGYINLAKKMFKNADIVIDRFHIVTQIYQALNRTRIRLCYKSNPNYNKLKHYWRLFLKNKNELNETKYYSRHYRKDVSHKEIVEHLVNTDDVFKLNYEYYQKLLNALNTSDWAQFKSIMYNPDERLEKEMKQALKLFREHEKYIENAFIHEINNGIIEGTNNLIKTVKRIAFGYRKFTNFTTRIILIKEASKKT